MIRPSTFSIVAYDSKTGELGIAVESKFLSVGAVGPWAQAGVGAIATQSWASTSYGPFHVSSARRFPVDEYSDRETKSRQMPRPYLNKFRKYAKM